MVTEDAAIPFAMVTGLETNATDYKGIALEIVKVMGAGKVTTMACQTSVPRYYVSDFQEFVHSKAT